MDRPAQSLECLSLLALERICFYIDDEGNSDDFRRSLWAFSLTSRRCCAAAAVQRFCQIHLRLRSADTMAASVQRCIDEALDHGQRFGHVRRLRVSGGMSRKEAQLIKTKEHAAQGRARHPSPMAMKRARAETKDDRDAGEVDRVLHTKLGHDIRHVFGDDLHSFCRPRHDRHERLVYGASISTDAVNFTFGADGAWLPLADLVRQLSGLRDLVWDATSYLPRHVLDAVHETPSLRPAHRSGGCRIHMHQFALHSLTQYRALRTQSPIHADEYALVISPNLFSIVATVQGRMILDRISYTGDAILREMLGRGRSPNLRHVWFDRQPDNPYLGGELGDGGGNGDGGDAGEGDAPWQGFFPGQEAAMDDGGEGTDTDGGVDHSDGSRGKGKDKAKETLTRPRTRAPLTSLVFWNSVPPPIVTSWLHRGDFSHLRNLSLFWDDTVIEKLIDVAMDGQLAVLDSFTLMDAGDGHYIIADPNNYYGDYPDGTCYDDENAQVDEDFAEVNLMMRMFHRLPPLHHLQYEGTLCHCTARQIYRHHGHTLRKLSLTLKPPESLRYPELWLLKIDEAAANQLAAGCPHLEELALDVQRTSGDACELGVYRALSNEKLPFLERLELRLWYRLGPEPIDVEQEPSPFLDGDTTGYGAAVSYGGAGAGAGVGTEADDNSDDEIDDEEEDENRVEDERARREWEKVQNAGQIPRHVLEKAFADCALDATLARSIFDVLSSTSNGSGRLRHLRLDIARDASFTDPGMGDSTFMAFLRWLARPHVCERRLDGHVVVTETDPKTTKKAGFMWQYIAEGRDNYEYDAQNSVDAFLALWPNKIGPWWEDWTSFPLDGGGKQEEETD